MIDQQFVKIPRRNEARRAFRPFEKRMCVWSFYLGYTGHGHRGAITKLAKLFNIRVAPQFLVEIIRGHGQNHQTLIVIGFMKLLKPAQLTWSELEKEPESEPEKEPEEDPEPEVHEPEPEMEEPEEEEEPADKEKPKVIPITKVAVAKAKGKGKRGRKKGWNKKNPEPEQEGEPEMEPEPEPEVEPEPEPEPEPEQKPKVEPVEPRRGGRRKK